MGDRFHYPFAETLLLCADFVYQFEQVLSKNIRRKRLFIISDRGLYSFLTYQLLRIRHQYHASFNKVNSEKWMKYFSNSKPLSVWTALILKGTTDSNFKKKSWADLEDRLE